MCEGLGKYIRENKFFTYFVIARRDLFDLLPRQS